MKLIKDIKLLYSLLTKKYPKGWNGYDLQRKYYNTTFTPPRKKGIIFMCDGRMYHGGLADRLRGAITTYSVAKAYGKPFYINWVEPFNLTDYLLPNNCEDWRIAQEDISYNSRCSFPAVMSSVLDKCVEKRNEMIFKSWVLFNKMQTHVYTNLNFAEPNFKYLYSELFKPTPRLQDALAIHEHNLGENYWSFSFRFNQLLGDFKDVIGKPLREDEAEQMIMKNITELKCIMNTLPEGYKAFVASDSTTFLKRVGEVDSRIYCVPGGVAHVDQKKSDERLEDVWLKTFVDLYLIMNAQRIYIMRTGDMYKSGFPQFAALVSGRTFIDHKF